MSACLLGHGRAFAVLALAASGSGFLLSPAYPLRHQVWLPSRESRGEHDASSIFSPVSPARPPFVLRTFAAARHDRSGWDAVECDDSLHFGLSEVERTILEGPPGAWEQVDADMVVRGMRADEDSVDAALSVLLEDEDAVVTTARGVLSPAACASLRATADARTCSCHSVDVMDGKSEYQVALQRSELEELIGVEETKALWALPQLLEERKPKKSSLPNMWLATVSLRKYAPDLRASLGFHIDSDYCTANICLSPTSAHTGGHLLVATGGRIKEVNRAEGDAILHVGDAAHAVTKVTAGERYSLLLFYNRPGFLFQRDNGRFRRPAVAPSA